MATTSKSCRICGNALSPTHFIALFSGESLASDLANRLSKVADVPMAPDDGLSRFICRSCKHKLVSGECFRTTARASYEKNKDTLISTGSAMDSQVQVTNKRNKDTSGPGASPHTRQCRPVAKRLTPEHPGRRLTYPNCDNSMPLSDSCTECSTADGPSEQGIDVVGVSNLPHNPAEASSLFNNYANALHWITASNYGAQLLNYLDDFILLGIPVASEKLEGPTTTLTFLGKMLNMLGSFAVHPMGVKLLVSTAQRSQWGMGVKLLVSTAQWSQWGHGCQAACLYSTTVTVGHGCQAACLYSTTVTVGHGCQAACLYSTMVTVGHGCQAACLYSTTVTVGAWVSSCLSLQHNGHSGGMGVKLLVSTAQRSQWGMGVKLLVSTAQRSQWDMGVKLLVSTAQWSQWGMGVKLLVSTAQRSQWGMGVKLLVSTAQRSQWDMGVKLLVSTAQRSQWGMGVTLLVSTAQRSQWGMGVKLLVSTAQRSQWGHGCQAACLYSTMVTVGHGCQAACLYSTMVTVGHGGKLKWKTEKETLQCKAVPGKLRVRL
ncbi:hypothetical protein EMCRGX_G012030 [Ephydatia muelleri]